jgi:uncharacterized RDD family membrane protein YckC
VSPRGGRVSLPAPTAGIITRLLAAGVDLLVAVGLTACTLGAVVVGAFLLSPVTFTWPGAPAVDASLAGVCVAVGYLTVGWAVAGWTVGGAVLGVRVVARDGGRLGWLRSAARALFCVVVPLGLLWAAVSVTRRSLQDLAVGSLVVYCERAPAPERPRSR